MRTELIGKNEMNIFNIFLNRGINPNEIYRLDKKALLDPLLIKNLNESVDIVNDKITKGKDKILVVQDPDADGYTSTAIICNYLMECYKEQFSDRLVVLIHENKEHGIPIKQVEEILKTEKIDLIIAPDCSSNEYDVHKKIKENLGIDIVILDHHDAPKYSEYATMVNISLDDYPNKKLSGAGVCLKFAQLHDSLFNYNYFENYYDLATVGIIADMIEINELETIFIVQQGLRKHHNQFLKELYLAKKFSLGDQVTPIGISFYIAPSINAMTRVGTLEEKHELLNAMLTNKSIEIPSTKRGAKEGDTETLHGAIIRKMNNIKSRQDRIRDRAVKELEHSLDTSHQILILDTEGKYPRTFTGLIANMFMQKYKKPTLVGSKIQIGDKLYFRGSARGDDKSDLPELKQFEQDSGLFDYAEGHEGAHGFSFPAEKEEEIINYFDKELSGVVFEPVHRVDFDIDFKSISIDSLYEILRYSTFWGRGLEEPTFVLRNVPVKKEDVEVSGSFGDYKATFKSGKLNFIKFKGVNTEDAKKLTNNADTKIDVVGTIKLSNYKGEEKLQMFISDYEIKKTQKYIF